MLVLKVTEGCNKFYIYYENGCKPKKKKRREKIAKQTIRMKRGNGTESCIMAELFGESEHNREPSMRP